MNVKFLDYDCTVRFAEYANGCGTCIHLLEATTGEPIATATIAAPGLRLNSAVIIKDYSENNGMLDALIDAGVVMAPLGTLRTGFEYSPVCPLTTEAIHEARDQGLRLPV